MADVAGIYAVTNKKSGKVYIGSSVNINQRWSQHKSKRSCCIGLKNAFNKYGNEAFSWNILEKVNIDGLSKLEAKKLLLKAEQRWLDIIMPFGRRGYNILKKAGSHLGAKRSQETKDRLSRAFKGKKHPEWRKEKNRQAQTGKKMSPESSEKKKQAMIGRVSPMKGLKHSEKSKAKTSKALKGIKKAPLSEEHRKKLSDSLKGRTSWNKGIPMSEEAKKKLRLSKTGKTSPRKGATLSDETRKKVSDGLKKYYASKQ